MGAQIDSSPAMLFLLNVGTFGNIGLFKEVSGLDSEHDVIEDKKVLPDGKLATYRVSGMVKWSPIELKRGVDNSGDLWKWREMVIHQGQAAARLDGEISLLSQLGAPIATWKFLNGWPSKYAGSTFNANNNEVAMEGITIIHEGLERVL